MRSLRKAAHIVAHLCYQRQMQSTTRLRFQMVRSWKRRTMFRLWILAHLATRMPSGGATRHLTRLLGDLEPMALRGTSARDSLKPDSSRLHHGMPACWKRARRMVSTELNCATGCAGQPLCAISRRIEVHAPPPCLETSACPVLHRSSKNAPLRPSDPAFQSVFQGPSCRCLCRCSNTPAASREYSSAGLQRCST